MILNTTIGEAYIVTPVTLPLTIEGIKKNGDIVELLVADKPGQYAIVSPGRQIAISQDDAIVLETGGLNLSGSGTFGVHAPDGNYVRYTQNGAVKQIVFPETSRGVNLFRSETIAIPRNGKPVEFRLGEITDAARMFYQAAVEEYGRYPAFILRMPKATDITEMCFGCTGMTSLSGDFGSVTRADYAFGDCTQLAETDAVFPSLQSGIGMFRDCALGADAINNILEHLPSHEDGGSHIITFTGCPGASGCDHSIATSRGWTLEI